LKAAILKYNAGNVASVNNSLKRLGVTVVITDDHAELRQADRVILPGVGEASSAMAYLREKELPEVIKSLTQPVLGICLGLQLLCQSSEEGDATCLGILPGRSVRFSDEYPIKVPHAGWNQVCYSQSCGHSIMADIPQNSSFYFSHSFYIPLPDGLIANTITDNNFPDNTVIGTTTHGVTFGSMLQHENFYATQFHPEKSGFIGEKLIMNFLNLP
jgi:glutamine amidotransferase